MKDGLTRDRRFLVSYGATWRPHMAPDLVKLVVASDPRAPPTSM